MATETRKSTAAIAPFGLRMQPDLRARVEAAAEVNGRSMNAEIVERLESSFSAPQPPNQFEAYAAEMARMAAADAAVRAIDIVLDALNAPEGTSDAERFQMLVKRSAKGFKSKDTEGANG